MKSCYVIRWQLSPKCLVCLEICNSTIASMSTFSCSSVEVSTGCSQLCLNTILTDLWYSRVKASNLGLGVIARDNSGCLRVGNVVLTSCVCVFLHNSVDTFRNRMLRSARVIVFSSLSTDDIPCFARLQSKSLFRSALCGSNRHCPTSLRRFLTLFLEILSVTRLFSVRGVFVGFASDLLFQCMCLPRVPMVSM